MSMLAVDKLLNGKAPWVRFFVLGFLLAGGYYDIKQNLHDLSVRLDSHWERMDRIDRRQDFADKMDDKRDVRIETIFEVQNSKMPFFDQLISQVRELRAMVDQLRMQRIGGAK